MSKCFHRDEIDFFCLQSVTGMNSVALYPFEVCPPNFELKHGQSLTLEVLFSPRAIETYTHQMTMVCDNCHVRHFDIKGSWTQASQ